MMGRKEKQTGAKNSRGFLVAITNATTDDEPNDNKRLTSNSVQVIYDEKK